MTPHRLSGLTEPSGLQALCRTHHRAKTFGAYTQTTTSTHALDTTWTGQLNITLTTTPPNQTERTSRIAQRLTPADMPLIRPVAISDGQKLIDQWARMNGNRANVTYLLLACTRIGSR